LGDASEEETPDEEMALSLTEKLWSHALN
jgi:hypothetical protein